jgi:hypothetical protein
MAVGIPSEDVGAVADAGAVQVFLRIRRALWHQNTIDVLDQVEAGDQFGGALTG